MAEKAPVESELEIANGGGYSPAPVLQIGGSPVVTNDGQGLTIPVVQTVLVAPDFRSEPSVNPADYDVRTLDKPLDQAKEITAELRNLEGSAISKKGFNWLWLLLVVAGGLLVWVLTKEDKN